MTARLLLDEMFHPRIATELTARGHECISVAADPVLRESPAADLLQHAVDEDRILVTNNVVDFEALRRQRHAAGEAVPPLIYISDGAFPRNRRFVSCMTAALDQACVSDSVTATGGVLWLCNPPLTDAWLKPCAPHLIAATVGSAHGHARRRVLNRAGG
ncbi:MAG TPA: DUF5615 family PIN-like protein [Mycobacterium sp.]|nr:DUF5615 family PIN-like protein [Mycobacterium sp.]